MGVGHNENTAAVPTDRPSDPCAIMVKEALTADSDTGIVSPSAFRDLVMPRSDLDFSANDEPSRTRRGGSDVLGDAVALYLRSSTHEKSEIRAFADLVEGLLDGASPAYRRNVALALAHRSDTPPEIARRLANDSIDIAEAMIVHSPVLTSSDLVEIMRRGREHVRCVGRRLDLAPDIAAVLVDSSTATPTPAPTRSASRRRSDGPAGDRSAPERPASEQPVSNRLASDRPAADRRRDPASDGGASDRRSPPLFKVPVREAPGSVTAALSPGETTAPPGSAEGKRMDHRLPDGPTFLRLDSAGRWRALQDAALDAATGGLARPRPHDVGFVGDRLLTAAVAHDRPFLIETLVETLGLAPSLVEAVLDEPSGEALAVVLLACGVGSTRTTSILLHHLGETTTLGALQDLAALVERTPRRTAERLIGSWREREEAPRRSGTVRQTDPAERREGPTARETAPAARPRGLRPSSATGSD